MHWWRCHLVASKDASHSATQLLLKSVLALEVQGAQQRCLVVHVSHCLNWFQLGNGWRSDAAASHPAA